MTKRLHVGRGSQAGLESALFAKEGMTGPSTVIEGRHGFLNAYSPSPNREALLAGLGQEWKHLGLLVRPFPCHGSFHGIVETLSGFRAKHLPPVDQVTRLSVKTSSATIARHGERAPNTVPAMQYSMPFCAALALARDIGDPRVISEETVHDPVIRALASRVELQGVTGEVKGQYQSPWAEVGLTVGDQEYQFRIGAHKGHP